MFNFIKKNDFYHAYARFLPYVKPIWFLAILGLLLTVPVGALDGIVALFLKPFMDIGIITKGADTPIDLPMLDQIPFIEGPITCKDFINSVPFIVVAFTLFQGCLIYFSALVNGYVGNRITLDIRRDLYTKLISMDCKYYDTSNSGMIIFRFFQDAELASGGLISNLKLFLTKFFSSVSLIFIMFYASWQLSIIGLGVLIVLILPLRIVRKKIQDIMTKTVMESAFILTLYNETSGGNKVIKSYTLRERMMKEFEASAGFLFKLAMRLIKETNWLSPVMHLVSAIGVAIVLWYSSTLIIEEVITPGDFVSFLTALLMLYTPMKSIGNNYIEVQKSIIALDRIYEIFETIPVDEEEEKLSKEGKRKEFTGFEKDIEFKNLSFSYVKGRKVLKNINIKIKKSQTVALVGNSGGGKSSICALIPRLYEWEDGDILIDGNNIRNYDLISLRKNIAYVFQDNFLFNGTLRENIVMGKNDCTDKEMEEALENACLSEFIKGLPQGLDTQIGERGMLLSGGQKQRVAIARAFIKNSPIVILDEATSALDNKSEKVVQRALENLMKDRTVIVIAHRLSTIQNADNIIVINDGEIVEQGTHDSLLKIRNGAYASLYNSVLSVPKEPSPDQDDIDPDKIIDQTQTEKEEDDITKRIKDNFRHSLRQSIK